MCVFANKKFSGTHYRCEENLKELFNFNVRMEKIMKLIALLPTPQHTVIGEIATRNGSQVIEITVWSETKTFRAVSVTEDEIEGSLGRASNTFYIAEYNGKDILLFISGSGGERKIVRIDAEIEVLKRLLRTSMNDYPQGKFLFNIDKTRSFYKGFFWLYDLTNKPVNAAVYTTSVNDIIGDHPSESLKEKFPILNRTIPARIQKGFFFTEHEVYWLDRPADTICKLTDVFYGNMPAKSGEEAIKEADEAQKEISSNIMLPRRTEDKKWVATRNEFDIVPLLLADVTEHISIPPVTRISAQNKLNHKSYGQYFIPTQGLYGKEMLNQFLVKTFANRLADDYSIVLRGNGFEMLYTKADVNAVYIRHRGDVEYVCDKNPPKPVFKTSVKTFVQEVEATPTVEEVATPTIAVKPVEEYENRKQQLLASVDAALPIVEQQLMNTQNPSVQLNLHEQLAQNTELDQWYVELFETPVLYSATELDLPVKRLAMNRVAIVDLPAPYGQLLAWSDVTHDSNIAALELENHTLVSFAAATFYCKDGRVFMTETHVRLDTTASTPAVEVKEPKEALADAVKEALKDMTLAEVLAIVSASAV